MSLSTQPNRLSSFLQLQRKKRRRKKLPKLKLQSNNFWGKRSAEPVGPHPAPSRPAPDFEEPPWSGLTHRRARARPVLRTRPHPPPGRAWPPPRPSASGTFLRGGGVTCERVHIPEELFQQFSGVGRFYRGSILSCQREENPKGPDPFSRDTRLWFLTTASRHRTATSRGVIIISKVRVSM